MNKVRAYTDEAIITAVKAGGRKCETVMAYLYESQIRQVTAFILERNGSEDEAKDIWQDAIVNFLLSVQEGRFEGRSAVSTYLFAISKNLWYRRFRRMNLEHNYREQQPEEKKNQESPEILLLSVDQQEKLNEVLGRLKTNCREVLSLWSQKYAMKEIAEKLGYQNEQVVRNKKNLCLKELKSLLKANPSVRALLHELLPGKR